MDLASGLASYVPDLVQRGLTAEASGVPSPRRESFPAAVLFADITGFTPLAERLAQRGPVGAEELTRILNDYFGRLGTTVAEHCGEVVKLAGDALFALWGTDGADLSGAVSAAAACALEVQRVLHGFEVDGQTLSLRIGIGAGEVMGLTVGGVGGKLFFLIAGDPLAQVAAAQKVADPGTVVASEHAAKLGGLSGTGVAHGMVELGAATTPAGRGLPERPPPGLADPGALAAFVPDVVLARLQAGQTDWLAELRRITPVFVNLSGLDPSEEGSFEAFQHAVSAVQSIVARFEGVLKEVIVDDKGTVLIATFGLPPLAHEDDASRAAEAAIEIRTVLERRGLPPAIGIATGRAFCGPVRAGHRSEYTQVGDVMNLSARLMQAAPGDVLCDRATQRAAAARIEFEALTPLRLKGKAAPVEVFRPVGRSTRAAVFRPLFGREQERMRLLSRLESLSAGEGGVLVVEGEAGIGKSRLVADLQERAASGGMTIFVASADAVERATPYHAWRAVFASLLGTEGAGGSDEVRRVVLEQLAPDPGLVELAPLLDAVVPVDLPDNEVTGQMTGAVRAANTNDLLVRVMDGKLEGRPVLVVVEDAHWLDSPSWALARAVAGRLASVLLVLATRPVEIEAQTPDQSALLRGGRSTGIVLDSLPREAISALVAERLGASSLSDAIAGFVSERSGGNPFFAEELAYALRDAGVIEIKNGEGRVAPGAADLSTWSFPETVEGIVAGRIDRLRTQEQLTVKVASVIGRAFAHRMLRDVYPIEEDRANLRRHLEDLQRLDLAILETPEPDLAYIFKHVITQQVAYNLMLFSQRRQLHRAVAEWYERTQDDLWPFYPLLVHHWRAAEEPVRTLRYLELAAEQAVHAGAYPEAVGFLTEALGRDDGSLDIDPVRRGAWERLLGEAHAGLGNLVDARKHLERAVGLLGWPVPERLAGLLGSQQGQVVVQALHRFFPARYLGRVPKDPPRLEAARAYERLGEIYFFVNESVRVLHAALRGLNLAEEAGPSPELARVYGTMSTSAGLMLMHPLARFYARTAHATAEEVGQLAASGWVEMTTALYFLGVGNWAAARNGFEASSEIYRRIGHRRYWEASMTALAELVQHHDGDHDRAAEMFVAIGDSARAGGNVQGQTWGLLGRAEGALRRGQGTAAAELLDEASTLLQERVDRVEQIRHLGLSTYAALLTGDRERAWTLADGASRLMGKAPPTAYYSLEAYGAANEVLTVLRADPRPIGDPRQIAAAARRAAIAMAIFATIFPIAKPRAQLLRGMRHSAGGRPDKAIGAWRDALATATRLEMPHEQARTHLQLSRHVASEAEAELHARAAERLFGQLGMDGELAAP